ncbi:MAG: TIGR03905 family TSCPD domain-containing protein [Clostridiales bacterium]|nr:TIGR03905 family TSCPD domain-containing protein [Clostridiales bacterium]
MMVYKTSGVCSSEIQLEIEEKSNRILSVNFKGGCSGNASGISSLVVGMSVDEVINRLEGISCGYKSTSCPDQLAKALKKWRSNQ